MGAEVFEATVAAEKAPVRALAVAGQLRSRQRAFVAVVPVASIRRNPDQPRKTFAPERLAELSESIRERGLLQPVVLKRQQDRGYLLMAGERRLRAAELAGMESVPALVRDDDPLEVGLIENIQREDLSPLEEAEALNLMIERGEYTHKALAEMLGKSRPYISNTLALVRLPAALKGEILSGGVEVSRELLVALARQPTPEAQEALWSRIKLSQLSVKRYREASQDGTGKAAGVEAAQRACGKDVLRCARKFGRALRALDWTEVQGHDRVRVRRALQRLSRRIEAALAVGSS